MFDRKSSHLDATERDYTERSSKFKVKRRIKPRAAAMKRIIDQKIAESQRDREFIDPRHEVGYVSWSNVFK